MMIDVECTTGVWMQKFSRTIVCTFPHAFMNSNIMSSMLRRPFICGV